MTTPTPETPEYTPDALHAKARVLGMGNVLSWTEGWLHAAADAWKADKLRLAEAEKDEALWRETAVKLGKQLAEAEKGNCTCGARTSTAHNPWCPRGAKP